MAKHDGKYGSIPPKGKITKNNSVLDMESEIYN